jgi:hypothetical protein
LGREKPAEGERRSTAAGAGAAAAAALAVVVIAGVVLGAVLLRPGGHLFARGRGPLGGSSLLVVGLAAAVMIGGLLLHGRLQERLRATRELSPVEQRLADATGYVTMIAPFAVPLLLLLLHTFHSTGGSDGGTSLPHAVVTRTEPPQATPSTTPHPRSGHVHHYGLMRILIGIAVALLVAVVIAAGAFLWRYFVRSAPQEPQEPYDAADDERELLAQAVDSGRRALLASDDPRAAVIACYAAMEESLAASGVVRHASDSPQDLLERAVASGLPAAEAAAELTALFREARYSRHPMDSGHRDRAAAALSEIADRLAALAPALQDAP